ncbi:MAG: hypothetical protein HYR89_00595 [Actinobacteria bacterium]|nr:hypothetical protein [Actinomycetota bacterium]
MRAQNGSKVEEAAQQVQRVDELRPTLDELFSTVTRAVPGFGGAYLVGNPTLGETQRLVIRMTDTNNDRLLRAEEILKRIFKPTFDRLTSEAVKADYDFVQLDAWHKDLQEAFTLPGVSLTDVQESRNRVVVGVEDPETQSLAVRALATERGVPDQALEIIRATPMTQMLQSKRRPMRGGNQIQFQTGLWGAQTGTCTLGVPAVLNGVNGFLTNSHCSRTRNELDNGRYWQATRPVGSGSQIGTEEVDPGGTCQ